MTSAFAKVLAGAVLVLAAAVAPASAHPTATTDVAITLTGDAVEVVVTSDAEALRLKLGALQRTLVECVDIRFDGVRADLRPIAVTMVDDQRVAVHLRGSVPASAARVTWRTPLVLGSYPIVIRSAGRAAVTEWLQGPQTSAPYALGSAAPAAAAPLAHRIAQYAALGFTHILPNGLDHILFVLGLFFLTPRLRPVLAQVTAFTVAHSITLGLTLYGIVSLPAAVVEPLIAASIAYVAVENLVTSELKPWRLALVFGFGLLHGMGFAEALARLNLPRADFLTTLVSFNAGVEAGQLAIIAAAALVVAAGALPPAKYRRFVVQPASAAIALAGVVWTIERLV